MSADNAYFVLHRDGVWSVAHGFMSPYCEADDPEYGPIQRAENGGKSYRDSLYERGRKFAGRAAALMYAHDRVREDSIVEYGVVEDDMDYASPGVSGESDG